MTVSEDVFVTALLRPDADVPIGLSNPEGGSAGKRFDVYRNNVAVSLTEALRTAFPIVEKLLGAQNFSAIAGVYLRKHPPASPLMMFYGEEMPGFLAEFPPVQKWGYLPDVAKLELAIRRSYHAEDAQALDPAMLETLSTDALVSARVGLSPSVHVIWSRWPIYGIWRFNTEDDAPKPEAGGEGVLVARPEYDPLVLPLSAGGGAFIEDLQNGASIGTAYEKALSDDAGFDLATTLGTLMGAGALTELETPE